jgi:hypothetical protein
MAKRKSVIQKFMKHSGSIEGPSDLSSRRGFSTGVGKLTKTGRAAAIETTKSPAKGKTRQAASLQ